MKHEHDTSNMLPIIRQLHDAEDNRERAALLLACPDVILLKYLGVMERICQRADFELGCQFIIQRVAMMRAVRGPDGRLRPELARHYNDVRDKFSSYARGEDHG